MTSEFDHELDLFLKYVDLDDCKEVLKKAGVYSLKDLKIVSKPALKLFLPSPAVERILRKRNKFAKQVVSKSKYPPMNEFLRGLNLEHVQEDLKEKMRITRVEHFRDATYEDLQDIVTEEMAKRIIDAYKKVKNPIPKFLVNVKETVMKFGNKVFDRLSSKRQPKQPDKNGSSEQIREDPERDPIQATVNSTTESPTGESQHLDILSSERHPKTQYESYQCNEPDDDGDDDDDEEGENHQCTDNGTMATAPPYSSESDESDTSSSICPDDWIKLSFGGLGELKLPRGAPLCPNDWVLVEAIRDLDEEKTENNLKFKDYTDVCSDTNVIDYFLSAREEDPFEYYNDVKIDANDITHVRQNLGSLKYLSDHDICDALRFVHSEQFSNHIFFDRPPPKANSKGLSDWHYLNAARVLTLKQVYSIATHLKFEECCEALRNLEWDFQAAMDNILQ